jgi:hypothetical protein
MGVKMWRLHKSFAEGDERNLEFSVAVIDRRPTGHQGKHLRSLQSSPVQVQIVASGGFIVARDENNFCLCGFTIKQRFNFIILHNSNILPERREDFHNGPGSCCGTVLMHCG